MLRMILAARREKKLYKGLVVRHSNPQFSHLSSFKHSELENTQVDTKRENGVISSSSDAQI